MAEQCAVLTGDLVGSTRVDRTLVDAAFKRLHAAAGEIGRWPGETGAFERFRGDGWQGLLNDPARALRAALLFSAAVRSVDGRFSTRTAVGIGPAGAVSPDGLGASDGPAFRLSGRLLDSMPNQARMAAAFDDVARGGAGGWASAAFLVAGAIAQSWTARQAEVMVGLLALDPPTHAELGARLGVTKQTVQGHFDVASGPTLMAALAEVEAGLGASETNRMAKVTRKVLAANAAL